MFTCLAQQLLFPLPRKPQSQNRLTWALKCTKLNMELCCRRCRHPCTMTTLSLLNLEVLRRAMAGTWQVLRLDSLSSPPCTTQPLKTYFWPNVIPKSVWSKTYYSLQRRLLCFIRPTHLTWESTITTVAVCLKIRLAAKTTGRYLQAVSLTSQN